MNSKKPLKIFLGDLTYDTIALSTDSMPTNIGYVASYCKNKFGDDVDVILFKYISDLENSILENPPDVLALSNYAWNHRISLEMFRIFKQMNPNGLTIFGGPNLPLDMDSQTKFLKDNPEFDIYIPLEGEIGFSNVIEKVLNFNSRENLQKQISDESIDGCILRKPNDNFQYSPSSIRTKDLDDIPSPYLNGLMDKFFDGKLSPAIQTNRGCPFLCSYCVDGNSEVNQVNKFSLERIRSELYYIATHVPETTKSMLISDLNFGMIPRDLEICDYIAKLQNEFDYPKQIHATTGKNSKERIIEAIKRLNGALRLWMSVQSMDKEVLTNIKRQNISLEQTMALIPIIKEAKLRTMSEVILGLPGETFQSHIETIKKLIKSKIDFIVVYTCMMLNGAEMNTPTERIKWGFKTKFRIIPRDFVKLKNGKKIIEIEEVIVASNTLSFDEYVELRLLSFSMYVTNAGVVYDPLLKFLREKGVDVFELLSLSYSKLEYTSEKIKNLFDKYRKSTINELWDSPEEIIKNYQNDDEYQKLLDDKDGINIMRHYNAEVIAELMDEWTEHILKIGNYLLQKNNLFTTETRKQYEDISEYCRGISHNPLGRNRMTTNPEFLFKYDVVSWINSPDEKPLENFKYDFSKKFVFKLTDEQFKFIEDKLEIFGDTIEGKSQVIKRSSVDILWRKPILLN